MNRLRQMFEKIAYAGMKSGGAAQQGKRLRWLGPLAGPVARFLDGGSAPSDPFYLTNRTIGQRLRLAVVVAVPFLLVAGVIGLAVLGYFGNGTEVAPPHTLTPEQVAAKMLPNLDQNIKLDSNRDIDIPDVHIEQGAVTKVGGTAHNNTDHLIENTEVVFDLTNAAGSRLGAVSTRIARIDARSSVTFLFPVEQRDATFALVREVKMPE